MNRYKVIGLVVLMSCLWGKAWTLSPEKGSIYINANIGFGYSPLTYSEDNIGGQSFDLSQRGGLSFDIGATYFLDNNIGISTGLGISNYRATVNLTSYSDSVTGLIDADGLEYIMYVSGSDIKEKQKILMLNIPLMAQYYYRLSDAIMIKGGAGFNFGFPIKKTYTVEESTMTTQAYYPELNFRLTEHTESGMYDNRTDWNPSGKLETRVIVGLQFEAGGMYSLNNGIDIDVKGYFNYGLNKLTAGNESYMMQGPEQYNSLSTMSGKMKNVSVGLKVGIMFDSGNIPFLKK